MLYNETQEELDTYLLDSDTLLEEEIEGTTLTNTTRKRVHSCGYLEVIDEC